MSNTRQESSSSTDASGSSLKSQESKSTNPLIFLFQNICALQIPFLQIHAIGMSKFKILDLD